MRRTLFLGLLIALPCFAQSGQRATFRLLVDKDSGLVIYLPDSAFTPGAIRTTDAKEVCSETTKQFRHTTRAMKTEVDREYGITGPNIGKRYERDHLIPLELAGADLVINLWDQEYPQAKWKDAVENWLHNKVCATLASEGPEAANAALVNAQHAIAENWYLLYQEMNSGPRPVEKEEKQDKPTSAACREFYICGFTEFHAVSPGGFK